MSPFPSLFPKLETCCSLPRLNAINQSHPLSKNSVNHSTTFEIGSVIVLQFFLRFSLQLWDFVPYEVHRSSHGGGFFSFRGKSSSIFGCAKLWNRKTPLEKYEIVVEWKWVILKWETFHILESSIKCHDVSRMSLKLYRNPIDESIFLFPQNMLKTELQYFYFKKQI